MFFDIQQKLQELSTIEECQQQIEAMKNASLQQLEKLNDAKRREKMAEEQNKQLIDKLAELESDLDSQKTLNKELKKEKLVAEQKNIEA